MWDLELSVDVLKRDAGVALARGLCRVCALWAAVPRAGPMPHARRQVTPVAPERVICGARDGDP